MSTREEKVNFLQSVYKDFTKATIEKVLLENGEDLNRALDVLMNYDAIDSLACSANSPVVKEENPRYPELADLAQMFGGPDLTMSVIDGVYLRNLGDMTQTVETLINISNEKDAIAEFRKISEAEKKALIGRMHKEQEERNNNAKIKIAQQIAADEERVKKLEEEKQRAQEAERRAQEEEEKMRLEEERKKKEVERNTRALQADIERINAEREKEKLALEQFKQKLEMEKLQTAANLMAEVEKQKAKVQIHKTEADRERQELEKMKEAQLQQQQKLQEAQALLEFKEKEAETKQRQLEQTLEEQRKEVERNRQLLEQKEIEKPAEEKKQAEEKTEAQAKVDEIKQIQEQINHYKSVLIKFDKQPDLCTLAVRYDGNNVIVSWVLGKDIKPTPDHWIGFYKVGQPLTKYRNYHKTGGELTGGHAFVAPRTPGVYQFKYFVDSSYGNPLAESEYIRIGPSLEIAATLAHEGNQNSVKVNYKLMSGELASEDWFGLFSATEINNSKYIGWERIGSKLVSVGEQGTINFEAPRTPGDYVVRYFPKLCKYTHFASSNTIRVQNKDKIIAEAVKDSTTGRVKEIKIEWQIQSVVPYTSDYIAIYKVLSPPGMYIAYKYVDPKVGTLTIEAPTEVGLYDLRYHSASLSKYVDVCRSNEIEIPNTDMITATIEMYIIVSHNIHSYPKSSWDWVGIYSCEETNNKKFQGLEVYRYAFQFSCL